MQKNSGRMAYTRRRFLGTAVGLAAGFSGRRNARGQQWTVSKQRATHGWHLPQRTGTKIVSVETFVKNRGLGVVCIRTDDGAEGWGMISRYTDVDISAMVLHRRVARHALGKDPAMIDRISDDSITANLKFPWSYVCRALSGIDTAIWDLLAKRQGRSVCAMLGGKPRPFPVYGSSMSRTIKPVDEAARLKSLRDSKGIKAFKIRIGSGCGTDGDRWPGRSRENVRVCRQELGEDIKLMVDANSCYTADKAIEVGNTYLADNNVCHFEEPCPYWELEWTQRVTKAIAVPVAGGEQDNDLAQWRRMITMDAVDIVQPDVNYVGGMTRALRVAQMAAAAGKCVVPHSSNLSMVTVFSLHLMGAIRNAGDYVEYSVESSREFQDMTEPALSIDSVKDGTVMIPDGPGWGVRIRSDWLKSCQRQVSRL